MLLRFHYVIIMSKAIGSEESETIHQAMEVANDDIDVDENDPTGGADDGEL